MIRHSYLWTKFHACFIKPTILPNIAPICCTIVISVQLTSTTFSNAQHDVTRLISYCRRILVAVFPRKHTVTSRYHVSIQRRNTAERWLWSWPWKLGFTSVTAVVVEIVTSKFGKTEDQRTVLEKHKTTRVSIGVSLGLWAPNLRKPLIFLKLIELRRSNLMRR